MKILFATSEAAPFIKTGGLGDVAYALPLALSEQKNIDIRVIMPYYSAIKYNEKFTDIKQIAVFNVPLAWRSVYCGLFTCKKNNITYYFIDNEYYFNRPKPYGDYDDGEKFAFFAKAVLETIQYIDFTPDVIHHNDWQTALIPIFLKAHYMHIERYQGIKTVFTIHNIEYQGKVPYEFFRDVLGLPDYFFQYIAYDDCLNFMVSAIKLADKVTTVSRTYAQEIKDSYYAHGIENVLREYWYKLSGIVNGIDTKLFNPMNDKTIPKNYNLKTIGNKQICKTELQKEVGLDVDEDTAVVGLVTRLVAHKGMDLVEYIFDEMMTRNLQVVVLGTGDAKFERFLEQKQWQYPGRVSVNLKFDTGLANRIYAGADFFLMPSKSEPCGLAQMISMQYGTIPIVRETGGLKDTVDPYNPETKEGKGFTFKTYNAHDMLGAIDRALTIYYDDKAGIKTIQKNGMTADFSWAVPAKEYINLYIEG